MSKTAPLLPPCSLPSSAQLDPCLNRGACTFIQPRPSVQKQTMTQTHRHTDTSMHAWILTITLALVLDTCQSDTFCVLLARQFTRVQDSSCPWCCACQAYGTKQRLNCAPASACAHVDVFMCTCVRLCVCLPVCVSVCLSVCPPASPSVCPSVCPFAKFILSWVA